MPLVGRSLRCAEVCLTQTLASIPFTFLLIATLTITIGVLHSSALLMAQNASPMAPNSDPTYQALRNLTLSGEGVSVTNVDLKRDVGTFHLRSGTVCFANPVQGR